MCGLSLVAASGVHSSSRCAGLSLSRPLLLRSTGSRRAGSVVVAHGPSCSAACGILPDRGSNPCPLHWQADSQPLCHQGSPLICFYNFLYVLHLKNYTSFRSCKMWTLLHLPLQQETIALGRRVSPRFSLNLAGKRHKARGVPHGAGGWRKREQKMCTNRRSPTWNLPAAHHA